MSHLYPLRICSAVTLDTKPCDPKIVEDSSHKPRKPCARSGHCAVADDQNLYIFGGYNPNEETIRRYFGSSQHVPLFGEVWRYHIPSNTWHLLKDDGEHHFRLASMSALRLGKMVLLYGGTSFPFGYRSTDKVSWLDLKSLEWQHKEDSGDTKPIRSYGQAIAVIGPYLYVYGGTTGWVYSSDIHRCHLQTGAWERVFDLEEYLTKVVKKILPRNDGVPDPRYRHEMLSDGKRLYVIGGGTSDRAFSLEKLNAFNTETKEWELMDTIPDERYGSPGARRCHGCCQLDNVGYISGGFDGTIMYDDIWLLSLKNLKWMKLQTSLPRPVYFHSSAITRTGCLFIHGGVLDEAGEERSETLIRVWLRIPSLLRLTWIRVQALLKDPTSVGKDKLQAMGVPGFLLPDIG